MVIFVILIKFFIYRIIRIKFLIDKEGTIFKNFLFEKVIKSLFNVLVVDFKDMKNVRIIFNEDEGNKHILFNNISLTITTN